jgi:hypothetical protein
LCDALSNLLGFGDETGGWGDYWGTGRFWRLGYPGAD